MRFVFHEILKLFVGMSLCIATETRSNGGKHVFLCLFFGPFATFDFVMRPIHFLARFVTVPGKSASTACHNIVFSGDILGAIGITAEVGMAHCSIFLYGIFARQISCFLDDAPVFKQLFEA